MALVGLSGGAAAAECAAPAVPELAVRLEPSRIERDDTLSIAELSRFERGRGLEQGAGRRFLFGFTETETRVDVRLRSWEETDAGGRDCAWVTRVEVSLAPGFVVRVAREATRDRCFFRHVLDHEFHHVRIEESEAARLVGLVEARLRASLAAPQAKPIATDGTALLADREASRLRDQVLAVMEEQRPRRERRHRDEVDTPEETTIYKVCSGVGAKLARQSRRNPAPR